MRRRSWRSLLRQPWFLLGLALVLETVMMRIKRGGYDNCVLPLAIALLIWVGMWFRERMAQPNLVGGISPLLLLFVALTFMDPTQCKTYEMIPNEADLEAGDQLLQYIHERPGRVVAPFATHLTYRARKELSYNFIAAVDWHMLTHKYPDRIVQAVARREVDTLVFNEYIPLVRQAMGSAYRCKTNPFHWAPLTFYPILGWQTRPHYFCELRGDWSRRDIKAGNMRRANHRRDRERQEQQQEKPEPEAGVDPQ